AASHQTSSSRTETDGSEYAPSSSDATLAISEHAPGASDVSADATHPGFGLFSAKHQGKLCGSSKLDRHVQVHPVPFT
ncbi:hypothetical protein, partial [Sporisorium scitamineum]